MSHPVEMTQHPPCSPTLSSEPEDLNQEISRKLKILDFVTLVLSHPSMMQAVREMATKELGTATKELGTATKELGTATKELGTATKELGTATKELGTATKELGTATKELGTA